MTRRLLVAIAVGLSASAVAAQSPGQRPADDARALELLQKRTAEPAHDLEILLTGTASAWRYKFRWPDPVAAAPLHDIDCAWRGPLAVPLGKRVRVIATSTDHIYVLKVPALSLDMTGIPGRLETQILDMSKAGQFVGTATAQKMQWPINVHVLDVAGFGAWARTTATTDACR